MSVFNNQDQPGLQMPLGMSSFIKRIVGVVGILILLWVVVMKLFVHVDAVEIVIVQSPLAGNLTMINTPGVKWQGFGTITRYRKSFQFWFSKSPDQGGKADESIKVRFNDGGHANLSGSCRIDLPTDEKSMIALHTRYGSQEAIEHALVRTVLEKSVFMTGPLMSSRESYAEKRNDLISFISEQAEYGVFKTIQRETKQKDVISGEEKTVTVVEIQKRADGSFETQEVSPLKTYHLSISNLSINSIDYETTVENQIKAQQEAIMQVQTAMATAKKAEQDVLTTEKQGEAAAARAKWDQEAIKAQKVTEAEQNLAVQDLETKKAALYKQQQILEGEGIAEKKRLVFTADGALEQKLDAYKFVMGKFADHMGDQKWVPEIVFDGSGTNSASAGGSAALNQFMQLLSASTARQLGLDMQTSSGPKNRSN